MTLSVPRSPEFADLPRQEQNVFYIPELEMVWKEICSTMKSYWIGYKIARRETDMGTQEHYADIISGIIVELEYRPIRFRINTNTGAEENFMVFDEGAKDQEFVAEEHAVVEIEEDASTPPDGN
jgi:hypothetical protein